MKRFDRSYLILPTLPRRDRSCYLATMNYAIKAVERIISLTM